MNRAPYKYFDYYTSADADLFFGREKETQMMVGEILSSRLLVLFARSGSGKTSLINAGMVPELKRRGYETLYVRFESDPLTSLQNAAREQLQHAGAANDLHGLLQNVTAARKKPLVVFLDQFEEFFLVFADQPALRQDFIAQIAAVKYDEQLPVFLVLSLREDYYASLHEFRSAIPSIFQNNANIRLGAFTDDEAKRAILLPLAAVGLQMEAGLADTIIHDLKPSRNGQERREDNASGIEPITLQIVCHKLWQMKPKDAATITAAAYEKCGGAQKILRNHVSELLQKIPQRQQGLVVRIFEALKTRDNTKLYRRVQDLQETLRLRDSRRLKNALQQLAEIGVLRHEQRSGDDWYEFKHDDLVPEVTAWIQARRERINRNRLVYAVSPAILFVLILSGFLFRQFNTFYLRFSEHDYEDQQPEIIITRGEPFQKMEIMSTGYLKGRIFGETDIRNAEADDKIAHGSKIGFLQRDNWRPLADKLELVASGEFLYHIGEKQAGIDTLLAALKKNKYSADREKAANVLVKLGQNDDYVVGALVVVLKDQGWSVRWQAADALVELGQSDDRVISVLVAALKDQDWMVREQAVGTLGKIKFTNRRVIGALLDALKDQDRMVRLNAVDAFRKIKSSDWQVISALLAALKDQDRSVREQAAGALGEIKSSDWQVISALLTALKDQEGSVREKAEGALGEIKSTDARVIGGLLAALNDQDGRVQQQAAGALIKLGQNDERVIVGLLAVLKDHNDYVRADAAGMLGKIKPTDKRLIDGLLAALKDQDYQVVRERAAYALGEIKSTDARVINGLLAALKDQDRDVRKQAAASLGKLEGMKSLPQLLTQLAHPLSGYRTAAAQALAQKDIPIDSTLQVIAKLRENERPWVRLGAWEAYELLEPRREAEKKSAELLHEADSLFAKGGERGAKGEWQRASDKYESAFETNPKVTHTDSLNAARAKFKQARCAAKLKRVVPALDDLKMAFEYNPTLRDTLQAEIDQPNNDWAALQGNWYLREVLLKK